MKLSIYPTDKLSKHAVIETGFPFKSDQFSSNPQDIPLVKGENLQQGYIDWDNAKYWPRNHTLNYEKYWLKQNDVVIAMDRPWVQAGLKWSYIKKDDPESFLVQRVARLRGKKELDQCFLRYLIGSSYFSNYIQPIVTGVNVPHISSKQIGDFLIPIPPLPVQKNIAAVLSAYDDLIENNTRRIALLEKMAEEIYREWFVRLRFPGHEQVTFHKGIPEGWEFNKLENIGFLGRGKSKHRPRNDPSLYGGDYPFIQTGEVKAASPLLYITTHTQTYNKKGLAQSKLWNPGTLLITIAANIAETAILTYPACMPDSIIGFVPNSQRVSSEYIKYSIDCLKIQMQNISQGTTQDNFSQAKLGTFKFLIPDQKIMEKFVQVTEPIFQQVKNLLLKNQNLQQTRERLLTRLISGKLPIEDLDIQFSPSMADLKS